MLNSNYQISTSILCYGNEHDAQFNIIIHNERKLKIIFTFRDSSFWQVNIDCEIIKEIKNDKIVTS